MAVQGGLGYGVWGTPVVQLISLTIMVAGTTPEDERDFGVEGNG